MEESPGTLYKHNPFQATITASIIATDKKFVFVKVPTASGKTFIGGMYCSYQTQERKKSVVMVTSSEILRDQMED